MIVFVLGKVTGRLELVSCFLEIVRIFGFGLLVRVIFYGWIIGFVGSVFIGFLGGFPGISCHQIFFGCVLLFIVILISILGVEVFVGRAHL